MLLSVCLYRYSSVRCICCFVVAVQSNDVLSDVEVILIVVMSSVLFVAVVGLSVVCSSVVVLPDDVVILIVVMSSVLIVDVVGLSVVCSCAVRC